MLQVNGHCSSVKLKYLHTCVSVVVVVVVVVLVRTLKNLLIVLRNGHKNSLKQRRNKLNSFKVACFIRKS